jgi:hypothetical protein
MTADAWVNTGAHLNRMHLAVQLPNGGVPQRAAGPGGPDQRPDAPNRPGPGQRGQGQGGRAMQQMAMMGRGPIQVDVHALAPDTTQQTIDQVIDSMIGDASAATRQTIARATTPQQVLALTLGSPEFQKR